MSKKERIDKVLANLGYGSRKEIKKMCKDGEVTIDGQVMKDSSYKFDPEISEITVLGSEVMYRDYIYLMMNKPQDVISATYDNMHETVIDIIADEFRALEPFPVGRLDKDTEGLMLISNDGKLSYRLLSPKRKIPKTYYAEVDGLVTEEDAKAFKEGVYIMDDDEEYQTLPADLKIIESAEMSKIELTIVEGKFHQVKRMFLAVDKEVLYLKRVKIGSLKLDEDLDLGEYRELTQEELNELIACTK